MTNKALMNNFDDSGVTQDQNETIESTENRSNIEIETVSFTSSLNESGFDESFQVETERISKVEYRMKVGINMHMKAFRNMKKI